MPEDGRRSYLVECYWPGVSANALTAAARLAHEASIDLRSGGHRIEFLGSILVPKDETVFCQFEGAEADVRAVMAKAGIPVERVLESLRIDGRQGG
jgi:hypothetical protein